jgi:hypothetical protein
MVTLAVIIPQAPRLGTKAPQSPPTSSSANQASFVWPIRVPQPIRPWDMAYLSRGPGPDCFHPLCRSESGLGPVPLPKAMVITP